VQAFYLRDFGNPLDEAQANPHKFRILKVLDYDLKYNEDLTEGRLSSSNELVPVIIFLSLGSHGHFYQIPPLLNAFQSHTAYLSDQDPERHYHLHAFAFDFREMPSVFSRIMVD